MIRLNDSFLQYTTKMTGLQKGRIESTLNTEYNVQGLGLITVKDWIVNVYLQGGRTEVEENYTTYSIRLQDYTKPKTKYWLITKDGDRYDIGKTGHEFMEYLQNLKATEKDVINCIKIEEELAQKEKQKELEEKQRLKTEQEEKRRREKEEFEKRKQIYIETGIPLLKPHYNFIMTELDKMIASRGESNFDIDAVRKDAWNQLCWYFGNPKLLKSQTEYYVTCSDEDFEHRGHRNTREFYRNVYKTILKIDKDDSGQTVSAKIRAFHSGSEYKPAKSKKTTKFFKNKRTHYEESIGQILRLHKTIAILCYNEQDGTWGVSDFITGLALASGTTKTKVLEKFKETSAYKNEDSLKMVYKRSINNYGIIPYTLGEKTESTIPYTRKCTLTADEVTDYAESVHHIDDLTFYIQNIHDMIWIATDKESKIVLESGLTKQEVLDSLQVYKDQKIYKGVLELKAQRA